MRARRRLGQACTIRLVLAPGVEGSLESRLEELRQLIAAGRSVRSGLCTLCQQHAQPVIPDRGQLHQQALAGGVDLQARLHLRDLALAAAALGHAKALAAGGSS